MLKNVFFHQNRTAIQRHDLKDWDNYRNVPRMRSTAGWFGKRRLFEYFASDPPRFKELFRFRPTIFKKLLIRCSLGAALMGLLAHLTRDSYS